MRGNRYLGTGDILKREEFEVRKEAAEAARRQKLHNKPKKLASAGKDLTGCPLLQVCVIHRYKSYGLGLPPTHQRHIPNHSLTTSAAAHCAQALAQREEAVRNGKLTTIVFIRERNSKGQEVSGYIDFAFRLKVRVFFPAASSAVAHPSALRRSHLTTTLPRTHAHLKPAFATPFACANVPLRGVGGQPLLTGREEPCADGEPGAGVRP
jgi:hypothetical protein